MRDCITANFTPEDKSVYLNAAADYYFRSGWRIGRKPKLRKTPVEYRDYVAHGVGNEYGVLQMLILAAEGANNEEQLRFAARLGIHYCGVLRGASRYRDLRLASQGFLRTLENSTLNNEVSQLQRLCGRACRMTNHDSEAIDHFNRALEGMVGRGLNEARANTLIQLCNCLLDTGRKEEAEEISQQVSALAKPGSMLENQAKVKALGFVSDTSERLDGLELLERNARENGWVSHANDLTLSRAYECKDYDTACKMLDEVLASTETGWNRIRAIIEKAVRAVSKNNLQRISGRDRRDLQQAYAYCHAQRSSLFNRCHGALWTIMEREGQLDVLYSLFKHGSFIWRLRGEDDLEVHYYERLKAIEGNSTGISHNSAIAEMRYFAKRAAILVIRLIKQR